MPMSYNDFATFLNISLFSSGLFACLGNTATIRDGSCQSIEKEFDDVPNDPFDYIGVCQFNKGTILDNACHHVEACARNTGEINSSSCIGIASW